MNVRSTLDLLENKVYYAQLVKGGKIRRIRILGVLNTFSIPEVCFQVINQKRVDFASYNFFELNEIGIGTTEKEAKQNYGRIKHGKKHRNYQSEDELIKCLRKIEVSRNYYQFFFSHESII